MSALPGTGNRIPKQKDIVIHLLIPYMSSENSTAKKSEA
jgi:hypothetical protein